MPSPPRVYIIPILISSSFPFGEGEGDKKLSSNSSPFINCLVDVSKIYQSWGEEKKK